MNNKLYCPDIQPLMQSLLAILADLDFAHECELERIETGSGDAAMKERLRSRLEAQHRERRAPYVHQLGRLQARIRDEMPDVDRGSFDQDAASRLWRMRSPAPWS